MLQELKWWAIPDIRRFHFQARRRFMPKVRQEITQAVFYLFRRNPKTGKIDGPCGTGFFVIRSSEHPTGKPHAYAVTNWHVACRLGASIIRVNLREQQSRKSRCIELDPSEWLYPANGDDLAIADISDKVNPTTDLVIGLHEDMFISRERIAEYEIGIGEDCFMCGLFVSHHGGERNVPVARFGNISMMASDDAPVKLETKARRPCHLVDTRSRTGFSGSPVFAFRTFASDLTKIGVGERLVLDLDEKVAFWGLLGIHCGQFWDPVEVRKATQSETTPIVEGDKLRIQSGMTIVIPAWRIKQFLDQEETFVTMRRTREEEDESDADRRPRPEGVAPADEANPRHLEDFKRLVDVAARKRPQGDQT